jgi:hypothetical protein
MELSVRDIGNNGLHNTTQQLMEAIRTMNDKILRDLWAPNSLLLMSVATCPVEWLALVRLIDEVFFAWKGHMDEMRVFIVLKATGWCVQILARAKYSQEVRNAVRLLLQNFLCAANIELQRLINTTRPDTNLSQLKRQKQRVLLNNVRSLHPHVFCD